MENLHYLFPTPLWILNIRNELEQNNITIDNLENQCYEYEKLNTGRQISNRGNNSYQSKDLIFEQKDITTPIVKTGKIIDKQVNKIYQTSWDGTVYIKNAWININRQECFNERHYHGNSKLSCCFYINVPKDSGNIKFFKNDNTAFITKQLGSFKSFKLPHLAEVFTYRPIAGDLIIFPSWLPHAVETNSTDKARISIALNYDTQ